MLTEPFAIRKQITHWAQELGFDAVGFAPAALPAHAAADLETYLAHSYHGDMAWMAEHSARRRDPSLLWDKARTAIILGHNYAPAYNPLEKLSARDTGLISCYALGEDYHDVIKKKLRQLAERITRICGGEVKLFVDTAPLMEKPLAAQSAVGWQGKHTCVVSREFGAWLFLGEILTSLDLPLDAPQKDHCGSCTRCLDICATHAFDSARRLDARKCIAYLTIEHQGHIPHIHRKAIGNRIYGCDDCLAVCPWNRFARQSREIAYHARTAMPNPPLAELLTLDDAAFRTRFARSPIKRIKRDRFIRNVLIAAGNSGQSALLLVIEALLQDASPLVRAAAIWALAELAPVEKVLALKAKLLPNEVDLHVKDEWSIASCPQ